MQVVILCGGKATRLYPLTKKIPKSMIPIDGKPFLEYQIELLRQKGFRNFLLCIGKGGQQIKKFFQSGKNWDVKIKYSEEKKKLLGTGGALKNAEKLLEKEFLVIYGDSYVDFDFGKAIKFFHQNNKLGLMTVYKNNNKIEPSNVEIQGKYVVAYDKKNPTSKMKYIDYGVSIFKKEALKLLPPKQFCDLSYLHKELIKQRQLLAYPVQKRYYQIGTFDGLEEFKQYAQKFLTRS